MEILIKTLHWIKGKNQEKLFQKFYWDSACFEGELMNILIKRSGWIEGKIRKSVSWKNFIEFQGESIPRNLAFEANLDRREGAKFQGQNFRYIVCNLSVNYFFLNYFIEKLIEIFYLCLKFFCSLKFFNKIN